MTQVDNEKCPVFESNISRPKGLKTTILLRPGERFSTDACLHREKLTLVGGFPYIRIFLYK